MLRTATKITIGRAVSGVVRRCLHLLGKGSVVTATRGGIRWQLDLNEGIDFAIYMRGSFEPHLVSCFSRRVKAGDTVLDIGANIGANTLPLASRVGPKGRVIAFEPTKYGAEKLRRNISLNPDLAPSIQVEPIALLGSDGAGVPEQFHASWPMSGHGPTHDRHGGRLMDAIDVAGRTLDGYLRDAGIDRVDFVKLDVDGHEADVLAGAHETLERHRPLIALELAPYVYAVKGTAVGDFDRMLQTLFGFGYRLHRLPDDRPLPVDPRRITAMIPDGAGMSALAVPQ